jgi:hypothetical protein
MVFNATFNNISVILWGSILLVKETRVLGENHRPAASHCNNSSGSQPAGAQPAITDITNNPSGSQLAMTDVYNNSSGSQPAGAHRWL